MQKYRAAQRNTRLKITLSFLAALLLALIAGASASGTPQPAQAAPPTLTGECKVTCLNPDEYGARGVFRVEFPAYGVTATGYCISGQAYGTPMPGTYPFTGTRQPNGAYRIEVDCSSAPCYPNRPSPLGPQNVGDFEVTFPGSVGIQKGPTPDTEPFVSGNPLYSLAGATYGLYRDEACSELLQELITDERGYAASSPTLQPGVYWLRERRAPAGYALDETAYRAELTAADCPGGTAVVTVAETPQLAPVEIAVTKRDAQTGMAAPQGDATLAGAVFRVTHYAQRFSTPEEAEASGLAPTLSFTVTSDEEGAVHIPEDALPSNGETHGFALGTVVVQEITPPAGYLMAEHPAVAVPVEAAQDGTAHAAFAAPTIGDRVIRGDLSLVKYGDKAPAGPGAVPLQGVAFDILRGEDTTPVMRIVTDDQGLATTVGTSADGTGALAFGTYLVREDPTTVPDGYRGIEPFPITIAEDGRTVTIPIENETGTFVQVQKKDASTGRLIQGRARFRVLDQTGTAVHFSAKEPRTTSNEAESDSVTDFFTDDNGRGMLPGKLNGAGAYYLQEVEAPRGYVRSAEAVAFTVGEDGRGTRADDPLVITLENEPQTSTIRVQKTDASDQTAIEQSGVTWDVRATHDVVTADGTTRATTGETVARIETDSSGAAFTTPLFPGSYELQETREPEGYQKAQQTMPLQLEPASSSDENVTQLNVDFPNSRVQSPEPLASSPRASAATGDTASRIALFALIGASTAALCIAALAHRGKPRRNAGQKR